MNGDMLGLYDIYDIYHVPFWHEPWFLSCIVITFCVTVIVFSLIVSVIFYRKTQNIVMAADAWVELLQKMQSIRPDGHATVKDCQMFYDCLTQVLKDYLQMRYGLALHGATDQEAYVNMLCADGCTSDVASMLPILERSVTVKFAGIGGLPDQCENDYLLVHSLIVSTDQYSLNNK